MGQVSGLRRKVVKRIQLKGPCLGICVLDHPTSNTFDIQHSPDFL
jgi:hypothetical protein